MSTFEQSIARLIRITSAGVVVILGVCVSPGMVAAISGHADVELAVSAMWSVAGSLHVVRNWLPVGARPERDSDVAAPIPTRERGMTILDTISSATARQVTATTLVFAAIGFVLGFVMSLSVAAYSLYVCTAIF